MNNNLIFGLISFVEKGLHLVILGVVIMLCVDEISIIFTSEGLKVESVLMLFIYLEIMQMVNIFFSTGKIPIRYPLYIGMFALARHISFDSLKGIESLYLSASVALLSLALVGLAYRNKLMNKDVPELPENE